jgi:WWE domain
MSAARIQELQFCISSLSEAASKLTAECNTTISMLHKHQAGTLCAQWQYETDQGWVNFEQSVNGLLEPAQRLSRCKTAFRLNGIAYTADLDTLVYRRQAKPSQERAIRRIGTADALYTATMVQMIDAFKQGFTQQEQKLTKGLRDTVAVLGSHAERQVVWEYESEHGWVAHSAEISAALENGCKVNVKLCDAVVSLQRFFAETMITSHG